jgi:hypothetical protein
MILQIQTSDFSSYVAVIGVATIYGLEVTKTNEPLKLVIHITQEDVKDYSEKDIIDLIEGFYTDIFVLNAQLDGIELDKSYLPDSDLVIANIVKR